MSPSKATGLAKDCDKAAHTLQSFIDKNKIPPEAIANAHGLAIYTCFRAGMYFAGSSGSGIVIARLPNGTWSPPSAFSVRSGGIGFVYGIDVYDCVCVLNTQAAVDAYTKPEMELGGVLALAAGPMGRTANIKEMKPVWTYTKSRGLYGGLTVDGTVIREKPEVNEEVYGVGVTSGQILRGEVKAQEGEGQWPRGVEGLMTILEIAGRREEVGIVDGVGE
ncbi:hypothetical protein FQN51_005211 [Onygenales sp. PD_10]|nr:hypothetical protein FQN51_005211 [Onygenales sp. PD_10]